MLFILFFMSLLLYQPGLSVATLDCSRECASGSSQEAQAETQSVCSKKEMILQHYTEYLRKDI